MTIFIVHLFYLVIVLLAGLLGPGAAAAKDECMVRSCGQYEPAIRFPFWLKDHHQDHCGYPGFGLSCNHNHTVFYFQFPVKASVKQIDLPFYVTALVKKIDYESQVIFISNDLNTTDCLPRQLPNQTSSASPFKLTVEEYPYDDGYTLFNCSGNRESYTQKIYCSSNPAYKIRAVRSDVYISDVDLETCNKMYNISYVPYKIVDPAYSYYDDTIPLTWSNPICKRCEAKGKYCRLKSGNATKYETECYGIINLSTGSSKKLKLIVTGAVVGPFVLVICIIAMYRVIRSYKVKKDDQVKIESFLEDYKAFKPTRYSYADIKKITNQFTEKLGQGSYGTVYKGKLSDEIFVAVKVLNNSKGDGEEFVNEVSIIGRIHHINVVRLVGYCADGFRRALVYEFLSNDSLQKFTSLENQNHSLSWEKLYHIALGTSKGIEYLHQGCDQRILHFDIKPHNILLDHNFNPKVSDFGQAKLCSKEQSIVSMTTARGTMGYIAPEVFSRNFGNVSYKSDVYSFGMLLLEMVGGKKKIESGEAQSSSQVYFPEWIYNCLDQGEEPGLQIEEEGDMKIAKKLTVVGLWCIQWYPIDRPAMKGVIQMLEGEDNLTMPPNPFGSTNPNANRTYKSELEIISE